VSTVTENNHDLRRLKFERRRLWQILYEIQKVSVSTGVQNALKLRTAVSCFWLTFAGRDSNVRTQRQFIKTVQDSDL
jgi:hypothetical protein